VSEYAIYLNDFMMHRARNELLVPFITRLPGTSDAPWVEEERARLIAVETVRRIVAAEYDEVWGKPKLAARCRAVQLFEQVSPAMAKAQAVLPLECAKQALKGLRGCLHPDLRVGSLCAVASLKACGDAEQPRQRASDARRAGERDGAAGGGGRRLPCSAGGTDTRAGAARMGGDAEQPRRRALEAG
jgi:hypothetical protein